MGLFDLFKKDKEVSIEEMMAIAQKWTDVYMSQFALRKGDSIRSATFIFCSWAIWTYYLQNNRVPKGDIANRYIASTCAFSGLRAELDVVAFADLFKTRFYIFKTDMRGLAESHYPETKQYIPYTTYCAFYHNQLSHNPTAGVDRWLYDDELHEFTGKLIEFWNRMHSNLK